jgi:hypothetical protein
MDSQQLQIPVPVFPEFRDDPENGITINRNRWSVYVPETWRAAIVKNADLSNVSEAALAEYAEQELLSEVEQVLSAAGRYSGAASSGKVSTADVWFQQQAVRAGTNCVIQRLRERNGAAGQQLEEAARKLSEMSQETEALQAIDRFDFLAGKDQQLNSYNDQNRTQFFFDNGLSTDGTSSYGIPQVARRIRRAAQTKARSGSALSLRRRQQNRSPKPNLLNAGRRPAKR